VVLSFYFIVVLTVIKNLIYWYTRMMHSLKLYNASHAKSIHKYVNKNLNLFNCNSNILMLWWDKNSTPEDIHREIQRINMCIKVYNLFYKSWCQSYCCKQKYLKYWQIIVTIQYFMIFKYYIARWWFRESRNFFRSCAVM
jgi:hypothetical protein